MEPNLHEYVAACHAVMPAILPVRVAAALSGLKEETFRARVLPSVRDPHGRGVHLWRLELRLGATYGPLEYLKALAKLEGVRRRERAHKKNHQPGLAPPHPGEPDDARRSATA